MKDDRIKEVKEEYKATRKYLYYILINNYDTKEYCHCTIKTI